MKYLITLKTPTRKTVLKISTDEFEFLVLGTDEGETYEMIKTIGTTSPVDGRKTLLASSHSPFRRDKGFAVSWKGKELHK